MLHHSDVQKHNKAEDLWVIVNGNAYDLTDVRQRFQPEETADERRN